MTDFLPLNRLKGRRQLHSRHMGISKGRAVALGVLGTLGLAAATGVGLVGARWRPQQAQAPLPPPAPPRISDPPPLEPALKPPVDSRPYVVLPPFVIVDGLTFQTEGGTPTRLAGLEAPGRDAVCLDAAQVPRACGLRARAALNNAIQSRQVRCQPLPSPDEVPRARCSVEGVDVGALLVEQGFARPTDWATNPTVQAARSAARGLWDGDWVILDPGQVARMRGQDQGRDRPPPR